MANAYKCDRCGAFYDSYFLDLEQSLTPKSISNLHANAISIIQKRDDHQFYDHYEMDLCPACMNYILEQLILDQNSACADCSGLEYGA